MIHLTLVEDEVFWCKTFMSTTLFRLEHRNQASCILLLLPFLLRTLGQIPPSPSASDRTTEHQNESSHVIEGSELRGTDAAEEDDVQSQRDENVLDDQSPSTMVATDPNISCPDEYWDEQDQTGEKSRVVTKSWDKDDMGTGIDQTE